MSPTIQVSVRDRLVGMVKRKLDKKSIDRPFSIQDPLGEIGLASIDMVNLLFEIEAEFDFELPQDALTAENFETIASIEKMMIGLRGDLQS
jgi:acyl carrier protein